MPAVVLGYETTEWVSHLKRAYPNIERKALRRVAEDVYVPHVVPRHFKASAKYEFKHRKRSKITKEIKKIEGEDPEIDLVASGKTSRMARNLAKVSVTSKARGVSAEVKMPVPNYFLHTRAGEPNKAQELAAISPSVRRMLISKLDEFFFDEIDKADNRGAGKKRVAK